MDFKKIKMNPIALIKGLSDSQKRNILTGIAMGSIPVTGVLAGIAGVKLNAKLEEYKERERAGEDIPLKTKVLELGWILFPPVTSMTIGEIAIHGINAFNAAELAALAAVVANQNKKSEIKDERIRKEFGEEKAKDIDDYVEKQMNTPVYDPINDPLQYIIDNETGREFYATCGLIEKALEKAKVEKMAELSNAWGDENPEEIQLSIRELYEYIADECVYISRPPEKKFQGIGWQGKDRIHYLRIDFEPGMSADGKRVGWIMTYSEEPMDLPIIM